MSLSSSSPDKTEGCISFQKGGDAKPIGVFDSGIGGLTVVSALRKLLPSEDIFYIGDTARVPYGGKSAATVERYGVEISRMLLEEGAKLIVVACNTASALALPRLKETLPVPVLGVITPGAEAAVRATRNGRIGVIGTKATVNSGAYERAIQSLEGTMHVASQACPMLVPLIEEGWIQDAITDQVIDRYLTKLLAQQIDTLVLGCTHYPLLSAALARFAGPEVQLVDSAANCALAVQKLLNEHNLQAPGSRRGSLQVALTDRSEGFLRVAQEALGLEIGELQLKSLASS